MDVDLAYSTSIRIDVLGLLVLKIIAYKNPKV